MGCAGSAGLAEARLYYKLVLACTSASDGAKDDWHEKAAFFLGAMDFKLGGQDGANGGTSAGANCEGGGGIARAPAAYIRDLYKGSFSKRFDTLLVGSLGYRTPTVLAAFVAAAYPGRSFRRYLDLGCGTGVSGEAFAALLAEGAVSVGVDLSEDMLHTAEAARPGLYQRLVCSDIETYHEHPSRWGRAGSGADPEPHDLVTCCDTFCYLGDLAPALRAARACLTGGGASTLAARGGDGEGGVYAFSTEELSAESPHAKQGYCLHADCRFAHTVQYLRRALREAGFEAVHLQGGQDLRVNKGRAVKGVICVARLAARADEGG